MRLALVTLSAKTASTRTDVSVQLDTSTMDLAVAQVRTYLIYLY